MAERLRVCGGRLLPAGAALAHTVLQGRAKRADFFGRCVFQRLEKGWLGPHFLSQTLEKGWLAKTAAFQHKVFDCIDTVVGYNALSH